jgi:deoxyhypusine synthase
MAKPTAHHAPSRKPVKVAHTDLRHAAKGYHERVANIEHGKFMETPTVPPDVRPRSVSDIVRAMERTGFQGRKLGEATHAWEEALKAKHCTIFLGVTGAMVPAGMRRILAHLIENRFVDVVVSTGAQVFHDIHESLGGHHFQGTPAADDVELFGERIDRMYDVYGSERAYRETDRLIAGFVDSLDLKRAYSSRQFMDGLGAYLMEQGAAKDSVITSAHLAGVPLFLPALSDSSIGIALMVARAHGRKIFVDQMQDTDEVTQITMESPHTGVVYLGGGVPKNWVNQTEVIADCLGHEVPGHEFAIQFTTDAPHWGGLSGCTFEEAVSWGKIDPNGAKVQCFVDATIALPIVAHALNERFPDNRRKRRHPNFDWSGKKLKVSY